MIAPMSCNFLRMILFLYLAILTALNYLLFVRTPLSCFQNISFEGGISLLSMVFVLYDTMHATARDDDMISLHLPIFCFCP